MTANNRAITLEGANRIFSVLEIEIEHHQLGHYRAEWDQREYAEKTLTGLCQSLLTAIAGKTKVEPQTETSAC